MESFAEFGYLGLFISSFLGATIIPLSSEIVLSILILNGFDLGLSLVLATTGNWLGGLSSYYLGSLGKWNIIEKYFRIKKEKITRFKIKIDKWGSSLAFLCCLPLIGDPIAVSLGFFKVNLIKVAFWMLFGKIVKYVIWIIVTYWGASLI
jgi:membrane protein YqaA with SNARE-associated domain